MKDFCTTVLSKSLREGEMRVVEAPAYEDVSPPGPSHSVWAHVPVVAYVPGVCVHMQSSPSCLPGTLGVRVSHSVS